MSAGKIFQPSKLPEQGVTSHRFKVWRTELEIFLAQDSQFAAFMADGPYATWVAHAVNPDRISKPEGADEKADLPLRRTELCTFLDRVSMACHARYYDSIMQHSTSLQWIYFHLQKDLKIQEKDVNFLNIFDLKYEYGTSTIEFYNQYRDFVIANLRKKGDIIMWQGSRVLEFDEELSPTFEDLILANVLGIIDKNLPSLVRENYHKLMGKTKSLMDYKADILQHLSILLMKTEEDLPNELEIGDVHFAR